MVQSRNRYHHFFGYFVIDKGKINRYNDSNTKVVIEK